MIIKPDAVQRGLVGEIISRFEAVGLRIARMSFTAPSRELISALYAEHRQAPHFERHIDYMTSGPSCFIEIHGAGALRRARTLVGATDPAGAAPGTIRGDFGIDLPRNSVHSSDSPEAAEREITLVFPADPNDASAGRRAYNEEVARKGDPSC